MPGLGRGTGSIVEHWSWYCKWSCLVTAFCPSLSSRRHSSGICLRQLEGRGAKTATHWQTSKPTSCCTLNQTCYTYRRWRLRRECSNRRHGRWWSFKASLALALLSSAMVKKLLRRRLQEMAKDHMKEMRWQGSRIVQPLRVFCRDKVNRTYVIKEARKAIAAGRTHRDPLKDAGVRGWTDGTR